MSVRDDPVLFLQQGKGKTTGGGTAGGGSAITTTHVHRLNGPEHTLATDDDRLNATGGEPGLLPKLSGITTDTLHGDGTWSTDDTSIAAGTYELANEGGQSVIKAHGSMGSTETFDPTDGNVHTGTLDANVTYTLNAPVGSGACEIEVQRTGSGGPWTETWPGSVTWLGGSAPTPPTTGTTAIVILRTLDGGTTWLGIPVGGGSTISYATPAIVLGSSAAAGAATTVIRSDATIAAFDATSPTTQAVGDSAVVGTAAFAARRDHKHAMPAFASPTVALGTAAATGSAATLIRSDATIAAFDATVPVTQAFSDVAATGSAAFAARRDHVHGMPATPSSSVGGSSEHGHVTGETHLSDGSTTTYTLDEAFEPGSVEAWNTTTLAYLTVTETQPDQATVSAAGSSGDKITFSYAATLV